METKFNKVIFNDKILSMLQLITRLSNIICIININKCIWCIFVFKKGATLVTDQQHLSLVFLIAMLSVYSYAVILCFLIALCNDAYTIIFILVCKYVYIGSLQAKQH